MKLAALVVLLASVAAADEPGGKRLAPFVLEDVAGRPYDTGQHIGHDVVVLSFWATWCKPCKIEQAALQELYSRLKKDGLVVIGVSIDGPSSAAEVQNFVKSHGFTFPILLDRDTALLERYNPRGDVPFSLVVDRTGTIVETHQGYNPGDEVALEARLTELLAETPAPPSETAEDAAPHVEGTESLQVRYLHDNGNEVSTDDEVTGLLSKLTLSGTAGAFHLGARIDDVVFPGYDAIDLCGREGTSDCPWEDDQRIERWWLEYRTTTLGLRGGDFYDSLGRGLVFSVRKIDELGVDTSLRGGRAHAQVGPVSLTAIGGKANILNTDVNVLGHREDPDDVMAGGEATVALPYGMTVGARALWVDYGEAPGAAQDQGDLAAGGSFEIRGLGDLVSVYVEGVFINNLKTSQLSGKERNGKGRGLYASVAMAPVGGFALLLELKDYRRFAIKNPDDATIAYHEPPNLERFDQIVTSSQNNTGGRLLVEYTPHALDVRFYANALWYGWSPDDAWAFDEDVDNFGDKASTTLHVYAGAEKRWPGGLYANLSGGWRNEAPNEPHAGAPDFSRRLWHVEGDVQVPLWGAHSIGLRADHRSEEKLVNDVERFVRGSAALTYGFAPLLSVGVIWTWQTQDEKQAELANLAGEVVWHFSDWGQLSVYGGRNTGGIICVSGVCRNFPPFYGVRSELIARF